MPKKVSIIIFTIIAGLLFTSSFFITTQKAYAYNKPWDQGHDATNPNDPDEPEQPPPPPCDECATMCYASPVSCSEGNYIFKARDFFIPGTMPLNITRAYNSRDNMRTGLFGYGWSTPIDIKLVYISGDTENYVRILMPNGQRYDFTENEDGTYTPPLSIYHTLTKNEDGTYSLKKKNDITYEFNSEGHLTHIIDRNDNQITISHENGWPVAITDSSARTLDIVKGVNGKIAGITDFTARTFSYTYDTDGNLESVTDPNGNTTTYSYDAGHNLTGITEPLGNTVASISYTADGKVSRIIDKEGDFTYNYLSATQTQKIDNSSGDAWIITYDDKGVITSIQNPQGYIKSSEFDADYNLIGEIDENGNISTYTYDALGNVISKTDSLGNTWAFTYVAGTSWPETATDPLGRVIRFEYDSNGNQTRIIKDFGGPSETTTTYVYNSQGNLIDVTDPLGRTTYYAYDTNGYLIGITDPLGKITTFTYDNRGNILSIIDTNGNITNFTYDLMDRMTSVTDTLGNPTSYTYNANGNLIALNDAKGNTTQFEYDSFDRLQKEIRPEGQQTTYGYDVAGNLVEKVDAKNQKSEYDYDYADRLVEIRHFAADNPTTPVKTVTFSYDQAGNLIGYDDGVTAGEYTYDDVYRKLSGIVDYGAFQLSTACTYYQNGLKKTFTGPDGINYAYTYDSNNRLTDIDIPGLGSVAYNNYNWYRPTNITLPGGTTQDIAYNSLMRATSIAVDDPGQNVLLDYQYAYDNMSNILSKVTEHGNYGYGYDDLYRLTAVDNPTLDDEAFTYDAVGNRLTSAGITGTWTYNQNNELQGYSDASYAYDDNGNMIQKTVGGVVTNYVYNVEGRLAEVRDGSGSLIASYYYDPYGRRLWKEVAGVRTYFHYANEGLIGEYDAGGNEIKTYGYKSASIWTTDPLFMKVGTEYYFYSNDHLGTPQKMAAVNGDVVWSAKYTSFGEAAVDASSTITNNLRFPGQYYDAETGIHYNYFRYYDPKTGRYLRVDPIGLSGGINIFVYAKNNPLINIDPLGKKCWTGGAGGITAFGIGIGMTIQVICCDEECGEVKCCTVTSICSCLGLGASASSIFGTATSNKSGMDSYFVASGGGASIGLGGGTTAGVGPGAGLFYCSCYNQSSCD